MTAGVFPAGGNVEPGRTGPTGSAMGGLGGTITGADEAAGGGGGGTGGGGFGNGWAGVEDAANVTVANPSAIKRDARRVPGRTRQTCFHSIKESGTICFDVGFAERQKRSHGGRPWSSHAHGLRFAFSKVTFAIGHALDEHEHDTHSNHRRRAGGGHA